MFFFVKKSKVVTSRLFVVKLSVFFCMKGFILLGIFSFYCYGSIFDTFTEIDPPLVLYDDSASSIQEKDVSTTLISIPYSVSLAGVDYTMDNTEFGLCFTELVPPDGRNRAARMLLFSTDGGFTTTNYFSGAKIGSIFIFGTTLRPFTQQYEHYILPDIPVIRTIATLSLDEDKPPVQGLRILFGSFENIPIPGFSAVDNSRIYDVNAPVRWVITQQNDIVTGLSYILYYYSHPGSSFYFSARGVAISGNPGFVLDGIEPVDLQPGETKSIMIFTAYSNDLNTLRNYAFALDSQDLDPQFLIGISQSSIDSMINFQLNVASSAKPIPYSHSNLCQISSEVRDRISEERGNKKHFFSEPWFC